MRPKIAALTSADGTSAHTTPWLRRTLAHIAFFEQTIAALVTDRRSPRRVRTGVYALLTRSPAWDASRSRCSSPRPAATWACSLPPRISPPGPACARQHEWPATTQAQHHGRQPVAPTRSNRGRPSRLQERRAATSAPNTVRSPAVAGPTKQPSPSPTRDRAGVASPEHRRGVQGPRRGLLQDDAKTPNAKPAGSSPNSRISATPSTVTALPPAIAA